MNSQQNQPLVSVVVIFLDEERFLPEAIASIFAQTYGNWELLLVDDGSTDNSTTIAKEVASRHPGKVRYLEHEGHQNRGMSATRNLGLRHASGKYVAFLDGDDVWLPQKLERQVPILEAQPETGMLYALTEYWHSWAGRPEDLQHDEVPDLGVPLDTLFEPTTLLTLVYPLGQFRAPCMCSILARRDAIERIGGFENAFHGYYEDQAFLTKCYLSEKVFVSSGCWDRYRIHPDSCCASVEKSGQHESIRRFYLDWYRSHLLSKGITDPVVWKSLDDAVRRLGNLELKREPTWFLRVAEGNMARLVRAPDEPGRIRIEISKNKSAESYDTQVNIPGLSVKTNGQYVLNFKARSDSLRTIRFGFAMAHSPWSNLGLHEHVDLTPEWQSVGRRFVVPQGDDDARIHFDLGGSEISVELSSVTLLDLSEGRFVEQPSASGQSTDGAAARTPIEPPVPVNEVQFGSFRRLTPISRDFGCDRGRPIDRYYIENFLDKHRQDVRGRVLEIGENAYTREFGEDRVSKSDVLHVVEGSPQATIIADISRGENIPSDAFDCMILTQTLQLIYDVPAALRTIYRILKPGGVLLATFPGITQSYDREWSNTWYWNFTAVSARRLFGEAFSPENIQVEAFGNVLAAMSFLHGLAVDELTPTELDYCEPGYDVTITVRAVKPADADGAPTRSMQIEQPSTVRLKGASADPKAIILMYHRVAETGTDPFSLAVTPRHFAEQLEVLRRFSVPMPLNDLVHAFDNGGISRPTVVVTFDDGYADNLLNAKPLLQRSEVPATVFVTTGYIGGQREFWWDELDRLFLQPGTLPQVLRLNANGERHEWNLGDAATYSEERWRSDRLWKVWEEPPCARQRVFFEVWRLIQHMLESDRQSAIRELQSWAGGNAMARSTHRPMTRTEVRELARDGLIDVGAHTVTHPLLSRIPLRLQREEIQKSKADLEEILGRPIVSFAYPFGSRPDFTEETETIVREAGFASSCSTQTGLVDANARRFELPRYQVDDWSGEQFAARLDTWLNG